MVWLLASRAAGQKKIENLSSKTLIHTSKYGSWLPIGDHQGAGLPRNMPASHASNPFRLTFLDSRARFPMSHGRMIICSEIVGESRNPSILDGQLLVEFPTDKAPRTEESVSYTLNHKLCHARLDITASPLHNNTDVLYRRFITTLMYCFAAITTHLR